MFSCKYFICQEEDVTILNDQGSFPTDASQFSINQESYMFNLESDQTSGIKNIFIDTCDDSGEYLTVDFSKPSKFYDPTSKSSETYQEVEAL